MSEASVERIFSIQKFLDAPLRNALQDKVVQSALFVKFNLLHFGDDSLIPPSLRDPVKHMYNECLRFDEDTSSSSNPDLDNEALRFWQL